MVVLETAAVVSAASGVLGAFNARKQRKEQRRFLGYAARDLGYGLNAIENHGRLSREYADDGVSQMEQVLADQSLGFDTALRLSMGRLFERRHRERQERQRRLAAQGLDSSTVGTQVMDGFDRETGRGVIEGAAAVGDLFTQRQAAARAALAQAQFQRAGLMQQLGRDKASIFRDRSRLYSGVQIGPDTTATDIAGGVGSLLGLYAQLNQGGGQSPDLLALARAGGGSNGILSPTVTVNDRDLISDALSLI